MDYAIIKKSEYRFVSKSTTDMLTRKSHVMCFSNGDDVSSFFLSKKKNCAAVVKTCDSFDKGTLIRIETKLKVSKLMNTIFCVRPMKKKTEKKTNNWQKSCKH